MSAGACGTSARSVGSGRGLVRPQWLGRLDYRWAWRLQHLRREAILRGDAPEALWLLEHDPVVTAGRRDATIPDGLEVVRTERGGLLTWHGPGQLVGYVLIDAAGRGLGARRTVEGVEQGVIDWLGTRGVTGVRRCGYPGVWVDGDKICAVGMHFRRGVSMHGFALNLAPDLAAYRGFVPCGITDAGVTSLQRITGAAPAPWEVADEVGGRLVDTLALGG